MDFRTGTKKLDRSVDLTCWIVRTANKQLRTFDQVLKRLLDSFFASEKGRKVNYSFSFLAACPEAFWDLEDSTPGKTSDEVARNLEALWRKQGCEL